jgi:aminopeptidase YwaD
VGAAVRDVIPSVARDLVVRVAHLSRRPPARFLATLGMTVGLGVAVASAQLLDEKVIAALANEISGESAKRNLESLARQHRMRGSRQFRAAAEHIEATLESYGYSAEIMQFPADGKIFYGTQRSRPAWNAEFAELWEVDAEGNRVRRLASWEAAPITLAQDSESGEATGELVESGDVAGKFILTSMQPSAVADRGAAGIISYAQNQRTAWYGEDENLIRWGHLDTFASKKTFAFMVSLKQAREFQRRLAGGEIIRFHAVVRAGQTPGFYDVPTATIPGTDPAAGEIVFSCHLDHPRPGANDNASGCASILEVARSLRKLIDEKRLSPPRRTIRFVWPAEIEGTMALLNGRPELARRIRAAIHLDMVGGGPVTKAIFHVTRGPASLPSFVNDVAEEIGRFVNQQTAAFAGSGSAKYPLHAPEGGKEALQAEFVPFTMGSDHQIYTDSSFSIPAIYLNDWPDRYIHTNFDVPANIDPTKLKRAAFIAAASGWVLANFSAADVERVLDVVRTNELRRRAEMMARRRGVSAAEAANLTRFHEWVESEVVASVTRFLNGDPKRRLAPPHSYRRNPDVKGPLSVFGYDYLEDKLGKEKADKLRLPKLGEGYAYEVLNLVDGQRTVSQIRDDVSAIYGPVPLDVVEEYLRALKSIGVVY